MSVDLPDPLGPRIAVCSPALMARLSPSSRRRPLRATVAFPDFEQAGGRGVGVHAAYNFRRPVYPFSRPAQACSGLRHSYSRFTNRAIFANFLGPIPETHSLGFLSGLCSVLPA